MTSYFIHFIAFHTEYRYIFLHFTNSMQTLKPLFLPSSLRLGRDLIIKSPILAVTCLLSHPKRYSSSHRISEMLPTPKPPKSGIPLQDVIKRLHEFAPLQLAENWDNVGLLVEPSSIALIDSVLLTIDLTEDVVEEAVKIGAQLIISYHPNIFRPLKTVTQSSWKERIIIQCIKNNISVFSPHTSWDAMANGVNDWLGSALPVSESKPILPNSTEPIGMGRFLKIKSLPLKEVIDLVKRHIGIPHLRLGFGKAQNLDSQITTVALCAGSGATVLGNIEADLYLTGEMSHHEVLEATQRGTNVILCNHSDSERGYLRTFQKLFANEQLTVHVSNVDRDCLTTV